MATYSIDYAWLTIVAAFRRSIDWSRNGVAPSGYHARQLADLYNVLVAGRPKCLFSKSIRPEKVITPPASATMWHWAGHTSPCASAIRATWVGFGTSSADSTLTSYAYLSIESGLTGVGSGTVTTGASAWITDASTGTTPNDLRTIERTMAVNSDSDYRMEAHAVNGMRFMSLTVEEIPRLTIDPATDTNAVDPSPFSHGNYIHDAGLTDIFACADKVWKRCGKQLFAWDANSTQGVQRTSATAANLLDQTLTAWGADNPGFPVVVQYCGSLDSDNVACVFYCYASMASGDASIEFRVSGSTIATITVDSSTAQYFTQAGNLNGANASDNIQVLLAGDGVNTLTVFAVGAFLYVA